MNRAIITNLAQASIGFLRALADALNDLVGTPPASPEQAATPQGQPVEQEAPAPKKRGPKPKENFDKPAPPPENTISGNVIVETPSEPTVFSGPKPLDKMTTEERFVYNQKLIGPCVKATLGPKIKPIIEKYANGASSSRGITAETQAAFEAEIKAFMAANNIEPEEEEY